MCYIWLLKYFLVINSNIKKVCSNDLFIKGGRGWKDKRRFILGVGDSSYFYFEYWVISGCLSDIRVVGFGFMDNLLIGIFLKWVNGLYY